MEKFSFRRYAILILCLIILPCTCCTPSANQAGNSVAPPSAVSCSIQVADPRCEYLENPLGIDISNPRLNWKLVAAEPVSRGQRQTGYHILVASSAELLGRNKGDLWDSGMVQSDQSVHVVYEGKTLRSGTQCFWKLRIKDEQGSISTWSKPARWTMGLLDESDWKAKWIGTDQVFIRKQGSSSSYNAVPDPWFRKVFTIPDKPRRAVIYVASIGYHELYVNGKKVGDTILSPSVANHRKRARYVTYEITDSLTTGKNVIGLWLGVSWSIFQQYKTPDKPQTPLVIAQADIELPNGKRMQVLTDQTWKTHPGPNTLLGVWDFMNFGGELYDANKELPGPSELAEAGWSKVDLDDTSWQVASVFSPNLVISAEMIEPNRRIKEIHPIAVSEVSSNIYRIDMGVNLTGWLQVDVSGKTGDRIEFKFSERSDQPMTHNHHSTYIIGPAGKGTFRNHFNYFTGRWIQIEGLKYKPSPEQILCYLVRTDYRRAAQFECSNKLLNDIYNTTLWTFENLSLGGYVVDCPQRERMGYGGDAHATTETGLNNYSMGAFYTKWSQDWRDVQSADGNLPYTAPTYWGGGGPAWSGFCITLPWELYKRYGDNRILEQNFQTMQRWLAFLETKSSKDILRRWGGEWDFLGDWLWPGANGVNGDTRETLFFNNCYWIYNLKTAANIADVLGKTDVAAAYRARAERVRKAVHQEFFKSDENSYVNGFQGYLAIALLVGLPPEDFRSAVWKRLEQEILVQRKGHIHAGITAGAFLLKTLLAFDRQDLIFEITNKETYPGWGDMLKNGATTFWESWEGKLSLLHSSYLYIGTWFIEGLGGIKLDPQYPGFKRFIIKPGVLNEPSLKWVRASYDSIYGPIVSNWKVEGGKLHLEVSVPPNTTATLYLPTFDKASITENSQPLSQANDLRHVRQQDGQTVLHLESGRYVFECALNPPASI